MTTRKTTSQISSANDKDIVKIAGWVYLIRDIGKIVFILVQDRDGIMQVVCRDELTEDARALSLQDVIEIQGVVQVVKPGAIKDPQIANEFEIVGQKIHVYSKAATPLPLPLSDDIVYSETGRDTRLDHRVLDLRRKKIRNIFKIQESHWL